MSGKLTRHAYESLIREDLEWLMKQPRTLEREHIAAIVKASAAHEYGGGHEETMRLRAIISLLPQCSRGLGSEGVPRCTAKATTGTGGIYGCDAHPVIGALPWAEALRGLESK